MARQHIVGIAILAALALLLVIPRGQASALMEELTLEELTVGADSIVVGTVTDVTCHRDDQQGGIYTLVTLSVEDSIKGDRAGEIVVRVPGGEVDGVGLWVSDTPSFQVGERVLLFLRQGDNVFRVQGCFQGKYVIADDRVMGPGLPLWQFKCQITDIMRSHGIPLPPADEVIKSVSLELSLPQDHSWQDTGPAEEASPSSSGWETIKSEDFEGAFPNVWSISVDYGSSDAYWGDNSYRGHNSSWSAFCADDGTAAVTPPSHYPNNMSTWMVYGPFSLSTATDAELNFYRWNKTEQDCDYLKWLVSVDHNYWHGWEVSGDSDGWKYTSADLTSVEGIGSAIGFSQVWIAFRFTSDTSITNEGAFIDDIELRKYVSPANITSISPSSASAGTNSQVTIYGTRFGDTQGTSKVGFFRKSGEAFREATIVGWSNTAITCEVPKLASSGPVFVRTAAGDSNEYDFTVTFSYSGHRWFGADPMGEKFLVNANTADCDGELWAVIEAAQTWNDVDDANFYFEYGGTTTAADKSENGHNEIMWVNSLPEGTVAQAQHWYWSPSGEIYEADIAFNDLHYDWDTSGSPSGSERDVQSTATHEFGHWLNLKDLYGTDDSEKTMYGYGAAGQTKRRTLELDDIAGIKYIYPGTGTRGQYHVRVTNSDDDPLTVYFKADTDAAWDNYRNVEVGAGDTEDSFWQVLDSGDHTVSFRWTDPDTGTAVTQTSPVQAVGVEQDVEFAFTITRNRLGNDSPAISDVVPENFSFLVKSDSWCGVGIYPTTDHDIWVDDDSDVSSAYASSTNMGTARDFVAVNGHSWGDATHYAQVSWGSPSTYTIEAEWEAYDLTVDTPYSDSMGSGEVLQMYEVPLTAGQEYDVNVDITSGSADLSVFVYGPSRSSGSRGDYGWKSDGAGSGGDESLRLTAGTTGDYGIIVVNENDGSADYDISVILAPTISYSPSSFSFEATEGGYNPPNQTLGIWNSGGGTLDWTVSDDADWLSLDPIEESSTGETDYVTLSVDISGKTAGSYDATITISAPGATNTEQTVPVSLTINCPWVPMDSGTPYTLYSVWGSSSNDIFAVGQWRTILHYEDGEWTTMSSGTGQWLYGVWGSSSNDVFAVGDYGTILHYQDGAWSSMTSDTTKSLIGVWGTASDDVFAVGQDGIILYYDGSEWSEKTSNTTVWLEGVCGTASDNVFAVGENGTILNYDGSEWSSVNGITTSSLVNVWCTASEVFAVGEGGTIVHYDGSAWSSSSSTPWYLQGVWGSSASDVFTVGGNGTILRYGGSIWSPMSTCTTDWLWGVWGSSSDDVFVVGQNGTILHYSAPQPPAWDPWAYDTNENGAIDTGEVLAAIVDYFDGMITITEVLEVIVMYFSPPPTPTATPPPA